MNEENKKILKIVSLIIAVMTVVTISTLSFAYFTTQIEEGDSYDLTGRAKSEGYNISLTESNPGITIENTYPMTDEMGKKQSPYTFTVKNEETSTRISVEVVLEVASTSTLADELVSAYIGDKVKVLNSSISTTPSEPSFRSAYKVFTFSLAPGESQTYDLRVFMNAAGTVENAQNKTWSSRVIVTPVKTIVDDIIASSNGVKNSGFEVAAETDEGVFEMEDDYGTSYYYRGAVENNYVKFAGFYWRIIRINGDGSLRILYDGTQAYANGISDEGRVALTNIAYHPNSNDAKYVGYMFGGANGEASTSKAQAQTNQTDSNIKIQVDEWYKTNIADKGYGSAVADAIFCNDRSTPGKEVTGWSNDTGKGFGSNGTAYGAIGRLYKGFSSSAVPSPSFKCPQQNDAFTVSDTEKGNGALTYPVGLITADEIAAAGSGKYGTTNQKYYLYKGTWYWSLSPYYLNSDGYAGVFYVNSAGALNHNNVRNGVAVVPVINLSAEYAQTLKGTGTMSDPYQT